MLYDGLVSSDGFNAATAIYESGTYGKGVSPCSLVVSSAAGGYFAVVDASGAVIFQQPTLLPSPPPSTSEPAPTTTTPAPSTPAPPDGVPLLIAVPVPGSDCTDIHVTLSCSWRLPTSVLPCGQVQPGGGRCRTQSLDMIHLCPCSRDNYAGTIAHDPTAHGCGHLPRSSKSDTERFVGVQTRERMRPAGKYKGWPLKLHQRVQD